jgi:hypothetical protein
MTISDDVKWGKLVKSWATGNNYFDPSKPAPPIPRSREELITQAAAVGVTIKFPDDQVGFAIMQYSPQTVTIKLPPKAMVEATEAQLKQGGAVYPMPPFYETFFNTPLPNLNTSDLLDLHAARIGDYSIRNCG